MEQQSNATTLPPDVERVRDQIEAWRQTRERRTRMPEELWQAAAALAREHAAWPVSQALPVRHDGLKRRLAETETGADVPSVSPGFVDLGPISSSVGSAPSGCPEAVVELTQADGTRLTVRLSSRTAIDVRALVDAFCRTRR